MKCNCNHPDPRFCHECEESTGVCYCKCHERVMAQERERAAYRKYGGCTCMGHGECGFCRER